MAMDGYGLCVASATWANCHRSKAIRLITLFFHTLSLECPKKSHTSLIWAGHLCVQIGDVDVTDPMALLATCSNSMPWIVAQICLDMLRWVATGSASAQGGCHGRLEAPVWPIDPIGPPGNLPQVHGRIHSHIFIYLHVYHVYSWDILRHYGYKCHDMSWSSGVWEHSRNPSKSILRCSSLSSRTANYNNLGSPQLKQTQA